MVDQPHDKQPRVDTEGGSTSDDPSTEFDYESGEEVTPCRMKKKRREEDDDADWDPLLENRAETHSSRAGCPEDDAETQRPQVSTYPSNTMYI
jgi:hypothetical protein